MAGLQPSSQQNITTKGSNQLLYDFICVGLGPAQLAIAIALQDSQSKTKFLFLERQSEFSWHPESHLPHSRMEHAFVYDLATMRNPRSNFTFVKYLHEKKRLIDFANVSQLRPLREEFHDYLKWCAEHFRESVRYGSDVVNVTPMREEGSPVRQWSIEIRDRKSGNHYHLQSRSIVVPSLKSLSSPTSIQYSSTQPVISTSEYLMRREELLRRHDPPLNITVVGSSEQTTEIIDDLITCPRLGNITFITKDNSLKPLKLLEEVPPPTRKPLCSIWAQRASASETVTPPSDVVQHIYAAAYEKLVASKGKYILQIVEGKNPEELPSPSDLVILEPNDSLLPRNGILHDVDPLVLACRQRGESLEEIQFKRGSVAEKCQIWLISASEGSVKKVSLLSARLLV